MYKFPILTIPQAINLKEKKEVIRLDITGRASHVEKVKVGPMGSELFDSAVSVTSSDKLASFYAFCFKFKRFYFNRKMQTVNCENLPLPIKNLTNL